jgi:predicted amino acid racemase
MKLIEITKNVVDKVVFCIKDCTIFNVSDQVSVFNTHIKSKTKNSAETNNNNNKHECVGSLSGSAWLSAKGSNCNEFH